MPREIINFDGKWLPDVDPLKFGGNGFKSLRNFRYVPGGVRQVLGYSYINATTALTANPKIRAGVQLRSNRTQKTYTLVWTETGVVYKNLTAIPDQGDFETTAVHTDASGASFGRLSEGPNNHICYANSKESYIWGGDEIGCAAFFTMLDETIDGTEGAIEYSDIINDSMQSTGHTVTLDTNKTVLVFSTRPLSGVKFYVATANASASTMTGKVYKGAGGWVALTLTDGTSAGGKTLAQTGSVTFASTVADAKPFHYKDYYYYAYLFTINAGTPVIYNVSVNAPWQAMVDAWDGTYRAPISVQLYHASKYEDYTLAAAEIDSSLGDPIGVDLGACTTTSYLYIGFEERMAAIKFDMAVGYVNTNNQTFTADYCTNGTTFASLTIADDTKNGAASAGKTGKISWNPPAASAETATEINGVRAYWYRIGFSGLFSGTHGTVAAGVFVDKLTGVPAQNEVPPFIFTIPYKNRILGCGLLDGNQESRIDFTATNAPDVWNGPESSMQGMQSLYAGGHGAVVAGGQLFNRFGNNIFTVAIICKYSSTHVISGDTPTGDSPLKCEEISPNIGCIAHETFDVATVGYGIQADVTRNIAIWLSGSGPVLFDGANLMPMKGIENYFDSSKDECINWDYAYKSWGKVGAKSLIYHLCIPSGSGATDVNTHFGFDLREPQRGWFLHDHAGAYTPGAGFRTYDTNGVSYLLGGIDSGYMIRMSNGATWGGATQRLRLETGDFQLGDPTKAATTKINKMRIIARRGGSSYDISAFHFPDTDNYSIINFELLDGYNFELFDDYNFELFTATVDPIVYTVGTDASRLFMQNKNLDAPKAQTHRVLLTMENTGSETGLELVGLEVDWDLVQETLPVGDE